MSELPDEIELPDGRTLLKSKLAIDVLRYALAAIYYFPSPGDPDPKCAEVNHLEDAKHWINDADNHNPLGEEHDHRLQLVINAVKEVIRHIEQT